MNFPPPAPSREHVVLFTSMQNNQLTVEGPSDEETTVVERFIDASRDLVPTVQVSLAKRIIQPGSNRVVCLAARTSFPLDDRQIASVSDLALRLSDGTNVVLSLSFFNDTAGGAAAVPFERYVYDPKRYGGRSDAWPAVAIMATILVSLAGLYTALNRPVNVSWPANFKFPSIIVETQKVTQNPAVSQSVKAKPASARKRSSSSNTREVASARRSSSAARTRTRDSSSALVPPPPPSFFVPPPPPSMYNAMYDPAFPQMLKMQFPQKPPVLEKKTGPQTLPEKLVVGKKPALKAIPDFDVLPAPSRPLDFERYTTNSSSSPRNLAAESKPLSGSIPLPQAATYGSPQVRTTESALKSPDIEPREAPVQLKPQRTSPSPDAQLERIVLPGQ